MMTDTSFDVTISTMTYGGEGLGRLEDGRAVFVPYVLPGEQVRVRLVEDRPRYARGELLEVLQPSPTRIEPRCPHFRVCGGCHYQHVPYQDQLELKAVILADQLERIGGLSDPPVLPTIPAPQPWNYRNHIQFHLTQDGKLGYVGVNARTIIPIRECHLPEDALNAIWPQLEFDPIQELERVSLRAGMEDDFLLILESEDLLAPALSVEDLDLSVVHMSPAGVLVLAGSEFVLLDVSGRLFHVSAPSFFQVNTPMAAAMVKHILGNVTLDPSHTVLDVYCGVGLFSAFIAPMVGRLVGVESNPYACDDFVTNLNEFEHVELYQDDAEAVLNNITMEPDLILVDPPRSGLSKPTLQGLLAQGASRIIYISCDPATLARDARHLSAGGYRLAQATPFDLFPQTYHIESISIWEKLPQGD